MTFYQVLEDFLVNNGYVLEHVASIMLFCHFFKKRRFFWLRFIGWVILLFGISMLWNLWKVDAESFSFISILNKILKYLLLFLLGLAGVVTCMDTSRGGAFFCMIGATATQHLVYRLYAIILSAFGLDYGSVPSFFIILSVSIVGYILTYFILIRRVKNHPERCFENKTNILLGGILIFITLVLHFLSEPFVPKSDNVVFIFVSIYDIFCCMFALLIEYGLFRNKVLNDNNEILEHLLRKKEEQYHATKANIEMINIKCHDIKHQISKMVNASDPQSVKELEDIVNIYDASLKTGNEALDVFLMEKKLFCEQNNIDFDCIVNGSCLSFMAASDIFSLFGNAIDNAIEALLKIDDTEKRIIGLTVKTQMEMVIIHCENYFQGELVFNEGLPETTKGDQNYHGFGTRSIRMIAEKYNGHAVILVQDGIFNLNVTIPIPN